MKNKVKKEMKIILGKILSKNLKISMNNKEKMKKIKMMMTMMMMRKVEMNILINYIIH